MTEPSPKEGIYPRLKAWLARNPWAMYAAVFFGGVVAVVVIYLAIKGMTRKPKSEPKRAQE